MFVNTWINIGILSIGKIKPDSIKEGRREKKVAAVKANCCDSEIADMNIPMLVQAKRKTAMLINKYI